MKKLFLLILILGLIGLTIPVTALAKQECITIQDRMLLTVDNELIKTGIDEWGYNYQDHVFDGGYCDAYHDADWCYSYKNVDYIMKWNDAWLSNKDCNNDGLLDESYIGSGAQVTSRQSGKVKVNGELREWIYFVRIIAAPSDAHKKDGHWFAVDGKEIGPVIWRSFAVIQEVYNDPLGEHDIFYHRVDLVF